MSTTKRSRSPSPSSAPPPEATRRHRRAHDDDRDDSLGGGDAPWWEQDRDRGASGSSQQPSLVRPRSDYHPSSSRDGAYSNYHDRGGLPRGGGGRGSSSYRGERGGRGGGPGPRGTGREPYNDTQRRNGPPYPPSGPRGASRGAYTQRPGQIRPAAPHKDDIEEGEIPLPYDGAPPAKTPAVAAVPPPPPPDPEPLILVEPVQELDPEQVLAERRRKRAEILAKYSAANASGAGTPVETGVLSEAVSGVGTPGGREVERLVKRVKLGTDSPATDVDTPPTTAPSTSTNSFITQQKSRAAGSESPTAPSGDFDLVKDAAENEAAILGEEQLTAGVEGMEDVSAADYNPDEDRKRDDERRMQRDAQAEADMIVLDDDGQAGNEAQEEEDDDDDDDMFSVSIKPKKVKGNGAAKPGFVPMIDRAFDPASTLTDNFDDAEGYYKLILGETLDNGRYHVHANLGKGMFSGVVRAKDLQSPTGEEVAIKVIRSQESMFKAGMKEAAILKKLMEADPTDKKHIIRLERTFEHRGHLCLVFGSLAMNLREVVKRFGKDVGINLRAVRAYASQMFLGLSILKKCDIMHADIKPDNILVNESKSVLKICDLGSASDVSENDITPYLVSRFYRAPEIILGLPYDCSLDTWSIGCTLYELYTGKILFPGRTNNHMLLLIMELKGKMNHKQLKRAKFVDQHFDESLNFLSLEKNDAVKTMTLPSKAVHDLRSRLMPASAMRKLKKEETDLLSQFVDLLDKMLSLDPVKRPTPKEMLSHPFIRGG